MGRKKLKKDKKTVRVLSRKNGVYLRLFAIFTSTFLQAIISSPGHNDPETPSSRVYLIILYGAPCLPQILLMDDSSTIKRSLSWRSYTQVLQLYLLKG